MGFWSKLILGGLGWTLGGPIGAIIGVLIANAFSNGTENTIGDGGESPNYDDFEKGDRKANSRKTTQGDFLMVLMLLAGSVMKADGAATKSELEVVKSFLRANFTEEEGKEALQMLKKILATNYSYRDVCSQIRTRLNYSGRLELVHLLFKIASADQDICQAEINVIYSMSSLMGVREEDYHSIKAAYRTYTGGGQQHTTQRTITITQAYSILEIESNATDDEVKRAYRRMAMKYHPDKVNTLGEKVRQSATEKFKAVGEAYQLIKEKRGMK